MSIQFKQIIEHILKEDNLAGGADSAFGTGVVGAAASAFSGDTYAPGSSILPTARPGVTTRRGMIGASSKRGKKGKKNKKAVKGKR